MCIVLICGGICFCALFNATRAVNVMVLIRTLIVEFAMPFRDPVSSVLRDVRHAYNLFDKMPLNMNSVCACLLLLLGNGA